MARTADDGRIRCHTRRRKSDAPPEGADRGVWSSSDPGPKPKGAHPKAAGAASLQRWQGRDGVRVHALRHAAVHARELRRHRAAQLGRAIGDDLQMQRV